MEIWKKMWVGVFCEHSVLVLYNAKTYFTGFKFILPQKQYSIKQRK